MNHNEWLRFVDHLIPGGFFTETQEKLAAFCEENVDKYGEENICVIVSNVVWILRESGGLSDQLG